MGSLHLGDTGSFGVGDFGCFRGVGVILSRVCGGDGSFDVDSCWEEEWGALRGFGGFDGFISLLGLLVVYSHTITGGIP